MTGPYRIVPHSSNGYAVRRVMVQKGSAGCRLLFDGEAFPEHVAEDIVYELNRAFDEGMLG